MTGRIINRGPTEPQNAVAHPAPAARPVQAPVVRPINNVPSGPVNVIPTPAVRPVAAPPQAAPSMNSRTTAPSVAHGMSTAPVMRPANPVGSAPPPGAPSQGVNAGELGKPWSATFSNGSRGI